MFFIAYIVRALFRAVIAAWITANNFELALKKTRKILGDNMATNLGTGKVSKTGGSLAIRLPRTFVQMSGVKDKDEVQFVIDSKMRLIVEIVRREE